MLPLLRAIGRELQARTRAIEELERRAEVLSESQDSHPAELRLIEADLALQRRELRSTEKELGRLGFSIDADNPHRIVGRGNSANLDDTRFYRTRLDAQA
jgi:hypothetical protein